MQPTEVGRKAMDAISVARVGALELEKDADKQAWCILPEGPDREAMIRVGRLAREMAQLANDAEHEVATVIGRLSEKAESARLANSAATV